MSLDDAVRNRQGDLLAQYFSLDSWNNIRCKNIHHKTIIQPNQLLPSPYDALVVQFMNCVKCYNELASGQSSVFITLYQSYSQFVNSFVRDAFMRSETSWELPILKVLVRTLYWITHWTGKIDNYEESARILSKCFTATMADDSKRMGSLACVNYLFRIYFQLNHLRLCSHVLKAIENPQIDFPAFEKFPRSEWITYFYYRARLIMSSNLDELARAEKLLISAFIACPMGKNRRQLLY